MPHPPRPSGFAVAYFIPHNEGIESGIITDAGFDSDGTIVDLYEVDATIKSFPSREEAEDWLAEQHGAEDYEGDEVTAKIVPAGVIQHVDL